MHTRDPKELCYLGPAHRAAMAVWEHLNMGTPPLEAASHWYLTLPSGENDEDAILAYVLRYAES